MPFVIPKYSLAEVADWEALMVEGNGCGRQLNEATAALINYLPVIGIAQLSASNLDDAWLRIAAHQAQLGSFVVDPATGRSLYLTREDVARHIGLRAEGHDQTIEAFWSYLCRRGDEAKGNNLPFHVANGGESLLALSGVFARPADRDAE